MSRKQILEVGRRPQALSREEGPETRTLEPARSLRLGGLRLEQTFPHPSRRLERRPGAGLRGRTSLLHELVAGPFGAEGLRALLEDPPDAVVIDPSRLPSDGREVLLGLRGRNAACHVPPVFVAGEPEKVGHGRVCLPNAEYAGWPELPGAVAVVIADLPAESMVPPPVPAGYSATPLPKKLGIKPGMAVLLVGAPDGFEATLGELPEGAAVRRKVGDGADLVVWFCSSRAELQEDITQWAGLATGGLWICWPKKASGVAGDLSEAAVREAGLAAGLVDHKVAALDAVWSGLRFARRRTQVA